MIWEESKYLSYSSKRGTGEVFLFGVCYGSGVSSFTNFRAKALGKPGRETVAPIPVFVRTNCPCASVGFMAMSLYFTMRWKASCVHRLSMCCAC